ncbi:MAG: hypothetical protein R2991_08870 [Thermoanaerobaculia bacterium]
MNRPRPLTLLALLVAGLVAGAVLADMQAEDPFAFTGARSETERLMGYYETIELTPEQEAVRVAALEPMPAACCKEFSAATCCCECNLSRATWGLAKFAIATLGYDVEQVRDAVTRYHASVAPAGSEGHSCSTGRCGLSFSAGGCGGMSPAHLAD